LSEQLSFGELLRSIGRVYDVDGTFGGDKDAAARIREELLKPALGRPGVEVVIDFAKVEFATQSFAHALLSSIVRRRPADLERITFEHCSDSVREIIEIVVQYSQETWPTN
jgi:anti-anti-sigma regulatory factor